jgi:hypothetical protein
MLPSAQDEIRSRLPPALPEDPALGVHALTEFIFCPRAGIIAWENGAPDTGGADETPPRLDYLPRFDIRLMEDELNTRLNRFWLFSALSLAGVATLAVGTFNGIIAGIVAGTVGTIAAAFFSIRELAAVISLIGLIREAKQSKPLEPSSPLIEVEDINWWELLAAGFISKRYDDDDLLRDDELKLMGKPWRILARGNCRIPVFLQRRPTERLYPQHFARIAAYCHLVEYATGFESPYGIVLHAGKYSGFAVPNSLHATAELQRGLDEARTAILALRREHRIPPAPAAALCKNCPLAQPQIYRRGLRQLFFGSGLRRNPFPMSGGKKKFCSDCGDRFRWIPPHAENERPGISGN